MKIPDSVLAFEKSGFYTSVDGVELFARAAGFDEHSTGPMVLCLHGIPTWSWLWRSVIDRASGSCPCLAVDLPGFGLSSEPVTSFSVTDLARTISRFLGEMAGQDRRVVLAVHDFGALVGAEMMLQTPGRFSGVIVTNTSLRASAWTGGGALSILSVPYLGQLSMYLAQPWMLQMAMSPFMVDPASRTGDRFAGYWYPFQRGFGQSLARLYQSPVVTPDSFAKWRSGLGAYDGPAMILWGAQDPAFTFEDDFRDVRRLLPQAETIIFDHASHFLPEERPLSVGRAIGSFVKGV